MKHFFRLLAVTATVLACTGFLTAGTVYKPYKDGQLYFKLKNTVESELPVFTGKNTAAYSQQLQQLMAKYKVYSLKKAFPHIHSTELDHSYKILFGDTNGLQQFIKDIAALPGVEYAERVPAYHIFLTPNDAYYSYQYALPIINAPAAWNLSTGSRNVKVAIVDDEVKLTHTDLAANKWVNPGEIAGNGIDDDGDGYVDDINGWDVGDNDNNPNPPASATNSSFTHGTHCAGIADAVTNNSTGVAGIGYSLSLMGVKCNPDNISNPDVIEYGMEGVEYAIAAHADVVSLSWGGGGYSATEQNVFTAGWNQGIIFIVAAGNDGVDEVQYPAQYTHCLAVGATDDADKITDYSNYGSWIGVMAPGDVILSTVAGTGLYEYFSGTSMATPLVAGLCGLMKSFSPSSTNAQIITCLKSGCDNINSLNPNYVGKLGSGRINAYNSLQCLVSAPVADFKANVTQTCSGKVSFTDLTTGTPTSWAWNFGDGGTSTTQNPAHQYVTNGTFSVSLTVTNSQGTNAVTKTGYITVSKPAGPSGTGASRCGTGTLTLSATGGDTIKWYSSATATTPLATSGSFTTPSISSTTTYYAEDVQIGASASVGPASNTTLGASSSFSNSTDQYLIFNCLAECTLKTVWVNASGAGSRVIALRDSAGNTLQSVTVSLASGANTVTLNFALPVANNLQLAINGTANLYRNNAVSGGYPFTASGLVSITTSSAGNGYYYYFYNWQLQAANCISLRTPVAATITPGLSTSFSSTAVSCYGGSNGSASVTIGGGTTPYHYAWSNGQTTSSISNVTANTYHVTVTDATGNCSATGGQTVLQPTAAVSGTVSTVNAGCASGGSATVTAAGGNGGYTYLWSNGATTATATGLAAGAYTVTITDNKSCTGTATASVIAGGGITLTPTSSSANCYGSATGSAGISVSGGTGNITYHWNNNSTTSTISNLTAGTYMVTATDAGGCSGTLSINVSQPASAVSASVSSTNSSCGSSGSGTASVTASGGTSGYTYHWSNNATTQNISSLVAGTYNVTVTDAHGCTATAQAVVQSSGSLVATPAGVNENCFGASTGSASVTVTGNTGSISYVWSNGATTSTINGLQAGTYQVTVTQTGGCSVTASQTVTQPTAVTGTLSLTNAGCGQANGSAAVSASGGTAGYHYSWSNGATSNNITGLPAGNYSVTITDAHSCSTSTVAQIINASTLVANKNTVNTTCYGSATGSASVSVTTGNAPFTYHWNTGGTAAAISGLSAGNYIITITDGTGCQKIDTLVVGQPSAVSINLNVTQPKCAGSANGSALAIVTGGVSNYTYLWSNNSTGLAIGSLGDGNYGLTVHDGNGCSATSSFAISEPAAIAVSSQVTNDSCNGDNKGKIVLSSNGGTAPYSYNWGNGIISNHRDNLPAGNYTLTVTDANNCTTTAAASVNQPAALQVYTSTSPAGSGLSNGSAHLDSVTGGTPPYQIIRWSDGQTTDQASYLSSGSYQITVQDANGCITTGTAVVGVATGVLSIKNDFGFSVFPNPAISDLIIQFEPDLEHQTIATVKDVLGQTLLSRVLNTTVTHIDVSQLAAGPYLIELSRGDQKAVKQLLITR